MHKHRLYSLFNEHVLDLVLLAPRSIEHLLIVHQVLLGVLQILHPDLHIEELPSLNKA